MKILLASGIFIPEIGGPATYVAKLSEQLVALGHQVDVVTYSDRQYPEIDQKLNYRIYRILRQTKASNYWRYFNKIRLLNQIIKYDLIYCFDHFSAGLPTVLANIFFKRKLFIRVGGDFIWERYLDQTGNLVTLKQFYEQGLHLDSERLRFKLIQWVFKRADKIIFSTFFQQEIFAKYYRLNFDKLELINNPIDKSFPKTINKQLKKEMIFAGRLINKNNVKNLIKAFSRIHDPSFTLHLIGDGHLRKELEMASKQQSNVYFEPKLTGAALMDRLQRAYLVIFPSLTDISPNTMLECLALNVAFISSQEIGFDWLKGKINTFNPLDVDDLVAKINALLDPVIHDDYRQKLAMIEYNYTYQQAAQDTLKLIHE